MGKGDEGCEKLADIDNNGGHFPEEKVEEMDNKTSFIMKRDEECGNNKHATLEIPTKIFHDQTAEGHSIAEISMEGDTLQTDGNVNLQTCDMTGKIPSSTVARLRITVERSIVILDDNIGKYADTS